MTRTLGDVTIEVPLDGWEHRLPTREQIRVARLVRRARERMSQALAYSALTLGAGYTECALQEFPPGMIAEASWIGYPKT